MSNTPGENEPASHSYSRGSDLLCDAAAGFDLSISDEQAENWRLTFLAMHELDGILDSDAPFAERSADYDYMVDVILGDETHACDGCYACELQVHMETASLKQREVFRANTELIKLLGEDVRVLKEVRQLGCLSVSEGRMSAELLEIGVKGQRASAFNRWLSNVGIFGTVIDNAIDLPSDYATGLTQVEPTLRNRLVLASIGVPYAKKVAHHINFSLARSFTKAVFAVSDDRTKDIVQKEG